METQALLRSPADLVGEVRLRAIEVVEAVKAGSNPREALASLRSACLELVEVVRSWSGLQR